MNLTMTYLFKEVNFTLLWTLEEASQVCPFAHSCQSRLDIRCIQKKEGRGLHDVSSPECTLRTLGTLGRKKKWSERSDGAGTNLQHKLEELPPDHWGRARAAAQDQCPLPDSCHSAAQSYELLVSLEQGQGSRKLSLMFRTLLWGHLALVWSRASNHHPHFLFHLFI